VGFLDRLLGNDHERAKTQYKGRESASQAAARARRNGHRNRGAARAARAGQDWETQDRDRETGRRTRR
jgi:hypothetical protein